ncbi:MAG: peptide deformylase [Candidatus Limnocylindrales bacterium]|nr:peptide deformylase [Candidatus Limnocylindrales bacterium]
MTWRTTRWLPRQRGHHRPGSSRRRSWRPGPGGRADDRHRRPGRARAHAHAHLHGGRRPPAGTPTHGRTDAARALTRRILVLPDPRLRLAARRIRVPDPGIRRLADEMLTTMRSAHGLGLAAPQVGEPLALVIIEVEGRLLQLANPVLVRASGGQVGWEGCLSVPGRVARVLRAAEVIVRAQDLAGNLVRVRRSGLEARAILHEIDHLTGRLYVDLVPAEEVVLVEGDGPSS